jgi:hypothetical protein
MRLNRLLPALLLLPLIGGCSYSRMPDWLVRMVGGPERLGKYVDGPLTEAYVVERAKLKLPPLTQDGAIRLQVAPSFGLYDYVLDFTPQPAGCLMWWRDVEFEEADWKRACGMIAVQVWRSATDKEGKLIGVERRAFYVPQEDYRDVIQSFNDRLPSWRGRRFGMLDGTGLEFEQVHKGKIGSMTANAGERGSDNPLSQLARDVHRLALAYGPADFFPRLYDWHSMYDPEYPCNGGLAGTDPDGMGAGDDACAAKLRARPR